MKLALFWPLLMLLLQRCCILGWKYQSTEAVAWVNKQNRLAPIWERERSPFFFYFFMGQCEPREGRLIHFKLIG